MQRKANLGIGVLKIFGYIYTQQIGSKEYYVDLDGVLPQVIEH